MALVNENYLKLKAGYLFPEIGRRVRAFAAANPSAKVIRLGIGDVPRPLPPAVLSAFHDAVSELGDEKTFVGYGPERGYGFLIDTLIEKAYAPLGVLLFSTEIFISDSSKCDSANIQEVFGLVDSPRLAGVPLLLRLLSPAGRPLQITRDLASFWRNTYPLVRKEMRGRSPKHPWPEDPLSAPPTSRAKPRR